MITAVDITAGAWVRFPAWEQWRYVLAARHVPFDEAEPRTTGYVQYDATDWPGRRFSFGGFTAHDEPCRIITITPESVS